MATYVSNKCPVCECGRYNKIGNVNEADPPVPIASDSAIVNCKNCRLIYVNPMPYWSSDDFVKLYDRTYFLDLRTDTKKQWLDIRKNHNPQMRFELIEPYIKSDKRRMLEIGAGEFAYMCQYLADKDWDVTAQEPSAAYQEKLNAIGIGDIKVEPHGIMELEGEGLYSLIYADSVLEHVPDPVPYYKKLANLLAPGGVLYTVSPNEYSMYNFILNFSAKAKSNTPHYIAPYKQPYHLIGFTKKSLEILGDKSGLNLVSYKKINDYMAYNMLTSRHSPYIKYPAAAVFALSQKLGMGTNGEAMFIK